MKIFALFLLIPLSASAADKCTDLGKYYADFEKSLANKAIPNCDPFALSDSDEDKELGKILPLNEEAYTSENPDLKPANLFEQVKCKDVAFIETRIRDVENQLNTLNGFKKLIETIEKTQDDVILDKKTDKDDLDGFIADVAQAAILESFISNPDIFALLALDPTKESKFYPIDLTNPATYFASVEKNCTSDEMKRLKKVDLCRSFISEEITESSLVSLRQLKASYVLEADDAKKVALLGKWQKEMEITKEVAGGNSDDEEDEEKSEDANKFSFVELNDEVQSKPIVTVAQMQKAIKSTTKFTRVKGTENSPIETLLLKMDAYKNKQEANKEAKRLMTVHNDLFERQKAERESRLSLLWLEFKPTGSTETDFEKRVNILKTIQDEKAKSKSAEDTTSATHLADALRALDATTRQMNKLELVTKCLDVDTVAKATFSKVCENTIDRDSLTPDIKSKLEELSVLKRVHTQITSSKPNSKLIQMKHLAMLALKTNKCIDTKFDSNILDCNIDGVINPEMKNLLITGLDVSLMYIQPSTEELDEAKEICESKDKSEYNAFCTLAFKEELKTKRPDRSNETYTGPMDPESRNNPFSDSMYNGARNVASMLGQMFQQNKAPYYLTNGGGGYGQPSPTISQFLIGSAVSSGELRGYTSVTQNNFAFRPR